MSRSSSSVDAIRLNMDEDASATEEQQGTGSAWQTGIVEDITAAYLQQVQSLVETARQMDSVFMKRSKGAAANANASSKSTLSDSEKIALQMIFDINAFEEEIKNVGISDPSIITCASPTPRRGSGSGKQ